MAEDFFEHYNPVRIIYGVNTLDRVGEYIVRYVGGNLALVLVDTKTFLGCRGKVDELAATLKNSGLEYVIYDKIPLNPGVSDLEEALRVYRESYADLIVGFGGQNVINASKMLAASIALGGGVNKVIDEYSRIKATVPVVTIPSTHGCGLEFTRYALIIGDDRRIRLIKSQALYSKLAVLDPDVALKTPLNVAVLSTIYALTNALTALAGVESNPLGRIYAGEAVETILSNYTLLLGKPDSLAVRGRLLQANMFAGMALDISGPGLIHVLAYTISGLNQDTYPGRIMAALLPSWLKHVLPRAGNKELISRVLGASIDKVVERVEELLDDMKASTRLGDIGLGRDDIPVVLGLLDEKIRVDARKILEDSL